MLKRKKEIKILQNKLSVAETYIKKLMEENGLLKLENNDLEAQVNKIEKESAEEFLQALLKWKHNLTVELHRNDEVEFYCFIDETKTRFGINKE